jgi:hypothetical protein
MILDTYEEPMLIRLLPEQVSALWSKLAPAISAGLPLTQTVSFDNMVRILESVLAERAVVWRVVPDAKEDARTQAIVMTTVYVDPVMLSHHLLIYSFYAYENLTAEDWTENFKDLGAYAKRMGVASVLAYTAKSGIAQMAKERLGAVADYTIIEF